MEGFVADYISTFTGEMGRQPTYDEYAHIMTGYTPEQVPVLSGIAREWVCQSDLAPLGGLVLARCGPTLDQSFPFTFGSSARAIRRGEGLEGEIESGAV
jgi:hypothetical protein